ncbi:MAG TPA: tRNA (cytidine(34)-2'-O)-methyltransferase [Steroidobacteraceae bacterium]|nr:tRNA (cytidine(34)-2'-O)-methyltransferase [Steroidobacteraceae bacterium]
MPVHVVLFEPEIPPNTGNVIRLCANTGARLHLIRPLGFRLDAKAVRRAGLDYRDLAPVQVHASLEACLVSLGSPRWFAFSTHATRRYDTVAYAPGDALVFGPETRGLPPEVLAGCPEACRVTIPMRPQARSLNLSNAVAVAVYEAWRQLGWP